MAFKQRKFRSKVSADDEEGEDGPPQIRPPQQPKRDQAGAAAKPAASAGGLAAARGDAKKDSKGSKLNLLSFEDDGDDPGFVPKKDSKKDKQARQSKLARAPPLPDLPTDAAPQTLRSTAGEYTAERLKELQRNAISFSATRLTPGDGAAGGGAAASEPVIKLSGSFKPAGAAKDDRFSLPGSSLALVQPGAEADAMPLPPPPRPGSQPPSAVGPQGGTKGPAGGGGGAGGEVEEDDEGDDGGIPDQQTILAAKAKRERLRQAHLAPDYIPTSGLGLGMGRLRGAGAGGPGGGGGPATGQRGGSVGPGGSGSAAEGGGGGSGSDSEAEAEETMRIRFSGKGEGDRPRKDQYSQQAAGGDDDEEAFAQEQLRKALRLQQIGGAGLQAPAAAAGAGAPAPAAAAAAAAVAAAAAAPPPSFAAFGGGSRQAAISAAGDSAVASLAEGLRRLRSSHKQVAANARRTADNLSGCLVRIEGLEGELGAAGDKYGYMQRLRAYVADLCDCLQVKSAIVEELEDTRLELMEDRAAAARAAATNAERDLVAPAEAAVAAAMAALGRGAGAAAAAAAAEGAARDAEDALLDEEGPEEVDEFGRNVNLQRRRELEARAAARKVLLAQEGERLAAAQAGGTIAPLTSAESDAAGEEQSSRYVTRYREIVEAGSTVFADADEEYASIGAVKKRLEEWKARYPKDYTAAYMHLSNPALFAPFVRLELLRWDPLYGSTKGAPYQGFDSQDWYGQLFEYGTSPAADGAAFMSDDDPDSDLVPQLVRKLVLPLALHWTERCWDVRNTAATRAVASLASELLVYVPAEETRMTELLAALRTGLEAAVEATALPPWPPALLAASPRAARVLFRRFRGALALLGSLAAFEGLLARGLLTSLALGRLVSGQLMPYLRAAAAAGGAAGGGSGGESLAFAVSTVEAVAAALHPDWFAGGPLAEGAVFLEHVLWLGRALEQQRGGAGAAGGAGVAALAARLARVMARVGDAERGSRLAAAFGIRSA